MFCPVVKSISIIGDKWILLILRECFFGFRKFDDFHRNLDISKSVLSAKLRKMIELDMLKKSAYQKEHERQRYEYRLTDKGRSFSTVLVALLEWGNEHLTEAGHSSIKLRDVQNEQDVRLKLLNRNGDIVKWLDTGLETFTK